MADSKPVRTEGLLDWVLRLKDDIELLECSVLCLWHGEPEYDRLYSIPDDEYNVCLGILLVKALNENRFGSSLTFHPIFASDTGHANWPRRPPALTAKLEKAMPLARISNDKTSTG